MIDSVVESNQPRVETAAAKQPAAIFATAPQRSVRASTNRGREILLFRYEALALPVNGQPVALSTADERREFLRQAERQFLVNTRQDESKLERLFEPQPVCNCHGWVFAGGRYGIEETQIDAILEDNGYALVESAREGDVAIWRRGSEITHSGLVRVATSGAPKSFDSKWGPLGVFRHAVDDHPFGGRCEVYRSDRSGHAIAIRAVGG